MPTGPLITVGPIGLAMYALMFVASFFLVWRYGVGRMFAYVYLPGLLFLFNIPAKKVIPALPFLTTSTAIGYGSIIGLMLRPDQLRLIRWNVIDTFMVIMVLPVYLAILNSDGPWEAYRDATDYCFVWLLPYFFARIALQDADARPRMLKVLCVSAMIIMLMAAYEARLMPNAMPRYLIRFGLTRILSQQVLYRWGLARAMATMAQPIDLGNVGVLVGGMILLLTPAAGKKWNHPLPLLGLCAAGGMVFGSVSITAWGALVVALVLYTLFSRPRIGPMLVVPVLAVMAIGMVLFTAHALNVTLGEKPVDDPAGASQWIRLKIIQDSWPNCSTAGWVGYGSKLDTTNIGVGSVDNAYLLFIMSEGWIALVGWIILAFILAFRGAAALKNARTASERLPVAAGIAGIFAMFYAMYTVFYGFVYATTLCVVFGMLSTMVQMLTTRPKPAPGTFQQAIPLGAPPLGGPIGGPVGGYR